MRCVPILLLGEALVDLVCEHPVRSLADADAFVPHPGGAAANAAVGAARMGAGVALAGGAGDDGWGAWLRDRLAGEGVGLDHFTLVPGLATPLAFATVDEHAEPSYVFYGDATRATGEALAAHGVEPAVDDADAVFLTSNTLVGERDRELTLAARARALEQGKPVVVDPNLRLHRWPDAGRAASEARALVKDAFLVKCNAEEARLLSGEDDPEKAAEGLLAGGARHVVITRGADGALLRGGGLRRDVPAAPAEPVSAVGAGDAFTAVLLAHLARTRFYPSSLVAALPEAAEHAARTTETWGALA
jgi:sugar/nucleoside kinase (ribokinase family)